MKATARSLRQAPAIGQRDREALGANRYDKCKWFCFSLHAAPFIWLLLLLVLRVERAGHGFIGRERQFHSGRHDPHAR